MTHSRLSLSSSNCVIATPIILLPFQASQSSICPLKTPCSTFSNLVPTPPRRNAEEISGFAWCQMRHTDCGSMQTSTASPEDNVSKIAVCVGVGGMSNGEGTIGRNDTRCRHVPCGVLGERRDMHVTRHRAVRTRYYSRSRVCRYRECAGCVGAALVQILDCENELR